jgi:predicted DNA-binding transcriptional regulator YafY
LEAPLAMPGPVGGQAEGPVPLSVIRLAIRTQTRLAIRYVDAQGADTERTIWPISVGFMEQARVVGAWCELRQDFRMFRADRIAFAVECGRYRERRAVLLKRFHASLAHS